MTLGGRHLSPSTLVRLKPDMPSGRLLTLSLCASLAAALHAVPTEHLFSSLQSSWAGAHADVGAAQPRVTLAAFLSRADEALRGIWDAAPEAAQSAARAAAVRPLGDTPNPLPGPYWRWIPEYVGETGAGPLAFTSPCFAETRAAGALNAAGTAYVLNMTVASPANRSCADSYLVGTPEWIALLTFDASASAAGWAQSTSFPVTASRPGSSAWTARHGARVLRFLDADPLTIVYEALETISLFIPSLISSPPDADSAARNYAFLEAYANISMPVRATPNVTVDPALIGSGDLLVIHRPDGLATLEQWGTGAVTSHVKTFMRREGSGALVVCESQSNGADWPIDRIQCNNWIDWQAMATAAGYAWVWMPLTPAAHAAFDNTAAWRFINSTLGVNYGFQDFAATFFDTEFDNLPWPARPESLELILGVMDGLLSPFILDEATPLINLLFTQTLVQHLGLADFNISFLEAVDVAAARGLTFGQTLALPEQDSWAYPMATGTGPMAIARVCNAYACSIQKAAGLFGALAASINCADTHNTDVETFETIDAAPPRPAACIAADPDYAYCQLAGARQIPLKPWRTPFYAHMYEHCPGLPVDYARPAGC